MGVLAGKKDVKNEVTIAPRDFSPKAAAEEDSRKLVRIARWPVRVTPSHVPTCGWRIVNDKGNRGEPKEGENVVIEGLGRNSRLTSFRASQIPSGKNVRVGRLPKRCSCSGTMEEFLWNVAEDQNMCRPA